MLEVLIWIAAVVVGLWGLHRLASWAEGRGWIYYMHRKASPGTAGRGFLEVQSLLEPGSAHVVESRFEEQSEDDESGAPPGTGSETRRNGRLAVAPDDER